MVPFIQGDLFAAPAEPVAQLRARKPKAARARPVHQEGSKPPGVRPTPQQEAVSRCRLDKGELVLVDAFAGSGKTTVLQFLTEANPTLRFLYVCYNKELADAASKRFGRNVDCKTSHSLGFRGVGYRYKSKIGNLRAADVRAALGLNDMSVAYSVLETLNRFLFSAKDAITPEMASGETLSRAKTAALAEKLWKKICDPKDPTIMPHDGYLKLWILSRPVLDDYDVVLLDEAQDGNPLLLLLLLSQWDRKVCSVVFVGDRHQAIYGWRQASNAMEFCANKATQRYALTESFRFNQVIADYANVVLGSYKEEENRLIGRGAGVRPPGPEAFLSRTNGGLIGAALEALNEGKRLHFAATASGNGWNPYTPYKFAEMLDVMHHKHGDRHLVKTPYLQHFRSYSEIEEAIQGDDLDVELKSIADVVNRYEGELPYIIKDITDACSAPEEADLCLSSGHRSKGKEWAHTVLHDDFLAIHDPAKVEAMVAKRGRAAVTEEVNLLYVVLTRTLAKVSMPGALEEFLRKKRGEFGAR